MGEISLGRLDRIAFETVLEGILDSLLTLLSGVERYLGSSILSNSMRMIVGLNQGWPYRLAL